MQIHQIETTPHFFERVHELKPYMSKIFSSGGLVLLLLLSGTLKLSIGGGGGGVAVGVATQCGGGTEKLDPEAS